MTDERHSIPDLWGVAIFKVPADMEEASQAMWLILQGQECPERVLQMWVGMEQGAPREATGLCLQDPDNGCRAWSPTVHGPL